MNIEKTVKIFTLFLIMFLVLIYPTAICAQSQSTINVEDTKKITVTKNGILLTFVPEKDGVYSFKLEDGSKNAITGLVMKLLDSNKNILNSTTLNKCDIYKNSYNDGESIAIAQGGEVGDSTFYYNDFEQSCYKGETYYLKLELPGNSNNSLKELAEEGAKVVDPKTGEVIGTLKDKLKNAGKKDAIVNISFKGTIENENESNSGFTRKFLLIIGIIILILITYKARVKVNVSKNYNDITDKSNNSSVQNIKCSTCGNQISKEENYCGYCGSKNEILK